MIKIAVIIICLLAGMESANFDDLLAKVKATHSETAAAPDGIVTVPEDEAALAVNSLGL